MIKTKSVYDPIDLKSDGLRVLVMRKWPRGIGYKKHAIHKWTPSFDLENSWDQNVSGQYLDHKLNNRMPHLYFMYPKRESIPPEKIKSLLTLPNIQYMVQGLDVFLRNNLDGDNRIKAIELRDGLLSYITSFFSDYRQSSNLLKSVIVYKVAYI